MPTPKPGKAHRQHVSKPLEATTEITSAVIGLVAASLVLFTYERALIPIYATGPTTYLFNPIIVVSVLCASLNPVSISTSWAWLYTALGLAAAPNATYWSSVWTSRKRNPLWGPAVTHLTVLTPLVFLLTISIVSAQLTWAQRKMHITKPPLLYRVSMAGLSFVIEKGLSQHLWPKIAYLNNISESQIFLVLAWVSWCLWIYKHPCGPPKRSKNLVFSSTQIKAVILALSTAMWVLAPRYLSSPVLPHPLHESYHRPGSSITIHSSVQSVTGLIVVGEAGPLEGNESKEIHSVRYLRASHSILGGVWIGPRVMTLNNAAPITDALGTPLGDSIYSTFVLQEAVRLVNSTVKEKSGHQRNGLLIGLGAGTSATAFIRNNVAITIVEIDAAVYDAARKYFGLPNPGPGRVFLEDARAWVEREHNDAVAGSAQTLYDFVVHDCFSGGGVPQHIFTLEFWKSLKSIMVPDGVVAVNFAGVPKSDATRHVLTTLEKSFVSCRAFHDLYGPMSEEQYATEFINIMFKVFFCTASKSPLTFRDSKNSDWLGSPLRRHVLSSLAQRELDLDLIRDPQNQEENSKYILTDAHNPLGKLQDAQGLHHWKRE
ncbi:hypothetical protein H0H93_000033 [Arthromyces matolae]|nr:hypothetical protein H0H93_000033 [Arthromyces matolae]